MQLNANASGLMDETVTTEAVSPRNILSDARNLLAEPGVWNQRETAADANGQYVHRVWSDDAVRFDTVGAVQRVACKLGMNDPAPMDQALEMLTAALPPEYDTFGHQFYKHDPIGKYTRTSGRTLQDILDLFDRAIAKSQQ